MGKKKRGGGGEQQPSSAIPRLAVDTSHNSQQQQPPPLPSPSPLPLPQAPLPPSQALIKLERYVHVANAWCDNTSACFPRSALQAQAQAQPCAASFGVSCAIQGRHSEADARITVLALSTRQPSLLLRMSGNAWASLEGEGAVEEGDYIYEWPILPTGGGSSSSSGGGGRSHSGRGSGRRLAGSGPPNTMACLALSDDLRRLLCVTREGNAYGLHVRRVVKAARRIYDHEHEQDGITTGNGFSSKTGKENRQRGPTNNKNNAQQQEKRKASGSSSDDQQQQQRFNPLGPSLFDFSLDPKYQRDGPGSLHMLPGGGGGTGSGAGGGGGGGGSGVGGGAQRRAKDISLGSMSAEGEFVPRCCVLWTPAKGTGRGGGGGGGMGSPVACSSMAIVGGTSGGRGALSILDMDQEREVDLLYIPSSLEGREEVGAEGRGVAALQIHAGGGSGSSSSSSSDSPLQQRILLITLASGRLYSLVLESSTDPMAPPSPTRHQQQQQQQQQQRDDLSPSRTSGSSSSSRRHSGSSSSSSSTPQNQKMKYPRAATLGLPPSSPMTPPRSSPHSTTTTEASSSSSSSPSTQSIGSLLLNSPQRGRKKGKKKSSSSGGGGREGGGGGGGGSSWGLNESNSSRVNEGQEEREAESLWDRCFARSDPYSSSLGLPRQPHIHTCFTSTDGMFGTTCPLWRKEDGAAVGGGGAAAAAATAARLPPGWWEDTRVVTAVQSISKEKEDGKEEGCEEAFGLVLARLSPDGRGLIVEVHYCALAASGGAGGGGGGGAGTAAAAAGAPACRCLCQMVLAEDLEGLGKSAGRSSTSEGGEMCVSRVIEATLMPEKFLVLSVAACRRRQGGGGPAAAAWGEDVGESEEGLPSSSYWLLTYRLPQDEAEDKDGYVGPPISPLLRAFQSPTKAPLSFLGWLVPVKPDIRDILTLARSRMFLPPTSSTAAAALTGPDDVLAWSLAVWSRCSIFLLRLLANKEEETMSSSPRPGRRGGFALPEFPLPSSLPSSLQARALAPGEMVAFVKILGKEVKVNEALTLAWSLLLCDLDDGSSNPAPKGPVLHPEYFRRLKGADPWLKPGGPGRARVALQCVRWMVMVGGRAPAGWTKEELLLFLEACSDYNLGKVVALLLARRRVSEALFASWVREKVPGLSKTLDCLAALASSSSPSTASSSLSSSSSSSSASLLMPLSRSDVAWLCGVGAGKCIIQAGRSVLWAVLPLRLQLDILLSDFHLLLLHEQYQWLLATLPTLPYPCLGALVLQLSYWLGLGPLPTREPPPPLPMSPRLVVAAAAFQEKEEGGARGVPLIAAWSSREGVVAGLAVAVDALAARTDTAAAATDGGEGEEDWEENEDEESHVDQVETEQNERKRRETRMLSDLLLEALLILAQPLAYTPTALQAHQLAQQKTISTSSSSTFLARPANLSLPEREALEAQLLLEQLLVAWTSQSAASATSFSSTSLSRNVHFTPAIILMRALTRTTTTPQNAGAAALLLEAAGEWEGALQVRLEEVVKIATGRTEGVDVDQAKEEAIEVLLGLLQSHVLLREDTLRWSTRKRMAAKLLESWARLGLPPDRLEGVILPSGDDTARAAAGLSPWAWHMGVALLTDLLILHAGASDSLVDADGAVVVPESEPLCFSPAFYVHLTEHIKAHGQAMQQAGVTVLWSTGGRAPALLRVPRPTAALWDALYKQIQGLEAGQAAANRIEVPLQRLLGAMTRGRSISSSGGGGDKRGMSTSSSRAGGRRILAPGGFVDRWAADEQEEEVPIVAFSCGHVLSQVELLERFVPALESKLTGPARPLHLTTEIFCQEYRALTGAGGGVGGGGGMGRGSHQGISLACPSCVTTFLVNVVNQQEQQIQ